MIHEEICTYEVCKLAEEKGFPAKEIEHWYCEFDGHPTKEIIDNQQYPIISQSLLQRWLREEKNIVVEVGYYSVEQKYYWRVYDTSKCDVFASFIPPSKSMSRYNTWEQALESGLKYGLKKLEQQ